MFLRGWLRQGIRQEHLTTSAGITQSLLDSHGAQHEMVPRIPPGGEAYIISAPGDLFSQAEHLRPRPAPESVFSLERSPRRDKRNDLDFGPKPGLKVLGIGFGDERDCKFLRGCTQEGCGDDEIAQAPEFDDE